MCHHAFMHHASTALLNLYDWVSSLHPVCPSSVRAGVQFHHGWQHLHLPAGQWRSCAHVQQQERRPERGGRLLQTHHAGVWKRSCLRRPEPREFPSASPLPYRHPRQKHDPSSIVLRKRSFWSKRRCSRLDWTLRASGSTWKSSRPRPSITSSDGATAGREVRLLRHLRLAACPTCAASELWPLRLF